MLLIALLWKTRGPQHNTDIGCHHWWGLVRPEGTLVLVSSEILAVQVLHAAGVWALDVFKEALQFMLVSTPDADLLIATVIWAWGQPAARTE